MKKFYTYALKDPETMKPFYVGKGTGDRIQHHERDARKGCDSAKSLKIRKIWEAGGNVIREILREFDSESDALKHEARMIQSTTGLTNIAGNHRKPKSTSFYSVVSDVVAGEGDLSESVKALTAFSRMGGHYRLLAESTLRLANKNNKLEAKCCG